MNIIASAANLRNSGEAAPETGDRQMSRYTYAYGYKSRDHAEVAIEELMAGGEISQGEDPKIERYTARICAPTSTGKIEVYRYQITLAG